MDGWLGGRFLWFVGLGLVGLLHVGIGILRVYGGWNTFDLFFVQYCSMCFMCLSHLVEGSSHTLRVTAIFCFWLFQANSLSFNILFLCNILLKFPYQSKRKKQTDKTKQP